MDLYVIRHAIAVDRDHPDVVSDAERWLTGEGIAKMKKAVRGLTRLVSHLDVIYTSPYVRAVQTAELVANGYADSPPVRQTPVLKPMVDFHEVSRLLASHTARDCVALVGHEPDLSELISMALFPDESASIQMKKGAVASLELMAPLRPGNAGLQWLLQPRVLRALGD